MQTQIRTQTISMVEVGRMHDIRVSKFLVEKHVDWRCGQLEAKYTANTKVRQIKETIEAYFPDVEWQVWHEPAKAPVSPPDAPKIPSIEWRTPYLPLEEIVGVLGTVAKVFGMTVLYVGQAFLMFDPILVAKIGDEYWEVLSWYESS